MRDRSRGGGAVGPILMSGMVVVGVIEGDQVGPLCRRQLQPGDDLIDALFIGEVIVEMQVIRGAPTIDFSLRAGPEEASAPHALLFRQAPQWGASIPTAVAIRIRIAVGVSLFPRRIIEFVGHDAVML